MNKEKTELYLSALRYVSPGDMDLLRKTINEDAKEDFEGMTGIRKWLEIRDEHEKSEGHRLAAAVIQAMINDSELIELLAAAIVRKLK